MLPFYYTDSWNSLYLYINNVIKKFYIIIEMQI
jgi:hypothetical protein